MRTVRLSFLALSVAVASSTRLAAASPKVSTDVGVFSAVLVGTHVGADNPDPVHGVVPGALLEVVQHVDRFAIGLEGIPTIGVTGTNSGPYGHSSAQLDLLNATAVFAFDPRRRFHVGAGLQIVNLTNKNGNNGDTNAVHIASPIYTGGAVLPLRRGFIETDVNVDPNLRGTLSIFDPNGVALEPKPEIGAEVDYRVAYRWDHARTTYRAGIRGLSYHTRNARNGELVDRNVGAGVTFDVRFKCGGS